MKKILVIGLVLSLLSACQQKSPKSTNSTLYSEDFDTAKERVIELKKHIKEFSDFNDAHFKLFNVNGQFLGERVVIPGPSSWDYQYVIVLDSSDIKKWLRHLTHIGKISDVQPWVINLNQQLQTPIDLTKGGENYLIKGDSNYGIAYPKQGILFRRIINN